jgi:hypothetical protein
MKNLFAAVVLAALLLVGACDTAEVIDPVTVSLDKNSVTELGLASSSKTFELIVSNTSPNEATVNWEHTPGTMNPSAWTYMINGATATSGSFVLASEASVTISVMVMPGATVGDGDGELVFYDASNQSETSMSFNYTYSAIAAYFEIAAAGFTTQSVRVSDPDSDYHLWVKNTNNIPVTVDWMRTNESANPSEWMIAVCTDATCYTPAIVQESMTIAAGDSVDFKTTFSHVSTVGNGTSTPIFYVSSDSANSVFSSITFNHEVTF